MAFQHGSNATISLDGQALTNYVDNVGFNSDVDLAETTTFGDDDKEFIAGLREHGLNVSGHYDATADALLWAMFDGATIAFSFSPDAGTTSYTGNGFLQSYQIQAPVGDKVSWTGNVQISGSVSRA